MVLGDSGISHVVFAVESTSKLFPFIATIRDNYLIPILKFFNKGSLDYSNFSNDDLGSKMVVISFHQSEFMPNSLCQSFAPSSNPTEVLETISRLSYSGGCWESKAHIAQALQLAVSIFDQLIRTKPIRGPAGVSRHLVLITNSSPYSLSSLFDLPDLDSLAEELRKRDVKLSIISPKRIDSLVRLFENTSDLKAESVMNRYFPESKFCILLNGIEIQAKPVEKEQPPKPAPVQQQQQQQHVPAVAHEPEPVLSIKKEPMIEPMDTSQHNLNPPAGMPSNPYPGQVLRGQPMPPVPMNSHPPNPMAAQRPNMPQPSFQPRPTPPPPATQQPRTVWQGQLSWADGVSQYRCALAAISTTPDNVEHNWPLEMTIFKILPLTALSEECKAALPHWRRYSFQAIRDDPSSSPIGGLIHQLQQSKQVNFGVVILATGVFLMLVSNRSQLVGILPGDQHMFQNNLRSYLEQQKRGPQDSESLPENNEQQNNNAQMMAAKKPEMMNPAMFSAPRMPTIQQQQPQQQQPNLRQMLGRQSTMPPAGQGSMSQWPPQNPMPPQQMNVQRRHMMPQAFMPDESQNNSYMMGYDQNPFG